MIDRWEKTGKIPTEGDDVAGNKLETYYTLLEQECKPKASKMISIMQLYSPKSNQTSMPLKQWITKVHNMVDICEYQADAKNRTVRDILISGCSSNKAQDKITREPGDPTLERIIEILQIEDSTCDSMKTLISHEDSTTASVHYARYDSNSKSKKKASNSNATNSTDEKKCYRCGEPFASSHMKNCKAKEAE